MNLSPIDVAQQQFSRSVYGLHPREVGAFLQTVAHVMTEQGQRMAELRSQLTAEQERSKTLAGRENDVKEALVIAQRAVDEVRAQAEREAELKLEEARVQAQKILGDAEGRAQALTAQNKELVRQRARLLEELRGLLQTHARLLDLHVADAQIGEAPSLFRHSGAVTPVARQLPHSDVLSTLAAPTPPELP